MRIGLLGAGRIGKTYAHVPGGIEAADMLLTPNLADPTVPADEIERSGIPFQLAFFRLAAGEIETAPTAHDGAGSARIAAATDRALKEHRIVRLEEIPA